MVSLDRVLDFLAEHRIRATFGAVGEATGIHHQSLRLEHQFKLRDPRTAWVVYKNTGQPPPEIHSRRSENTELITNGTKLIRRVRLG